MSNLSNIYANHHNTQVGEVILAVFSKKEQRIKHDYNIKKKKLPHFQTKGYMRRAEAYYSYLLFFTVFFLTGFS